MPSPTYTVADMRDKLLTLDQLQAQLSTTEPVSSDGFPVGDSVRFRVMPGWNHSLEAKAGTDPVDAFVRIGRGNTTELRLTKDALLEATSITGLPKGYAGRSPSRLLEEGLNYWFREGLDGKDFKILRTGEVGAAFTRSTVTPFSNLALLEQALAGIRKTYGDSAEVLADYKFAHSLQRTHFRLIVPETSRQIVSTRHTEENPDNWSTGIQIKNSLTGVTQTEVDGYLFAWWCTNGAITTEAQSGTWSRRGGGQSEADVMEWARSTVDEVLGGLEGALDRVEALTQVPVQGEVAEVLRDLFEQYRIPGRERERVVERMLDTESDGSPTMYDVMQAVTAAANGDDVDPGHVEQLMAVGGTLPTVEHTRCGGCRRLLPH